MIEPDWPAAPRVRALVTTRALGDMAREEGRQKLRAFLPSEPKWLRQVHGTMVLKEISGEADAVFACQRGVVCAAMIADCMPVLLADEAGSRVAVAHAGWRGLCGGVLENTVRAMASKNLIAWLGPAIGPRAYEVGDEVRAAFAGHEAAFTPTRPGHWLLDLYAVARQRLERAGIGRIYGGGFCTYTDSERFYSYRRDRAAERMAAVIWIA